MKNKIIKLLLENNLTTKDIEEQIIYLINNNKYNSLDELISYVNIYKHDFQEIDKEYLKKIVKKEKEKYNYYEFIKKLSQLDFINLQSSDIIDYIIPVPKDIVYNLDSEFYKDMSTKDTYENLNLFYIIKAIKRQIGNKYFEIIPKLCNYYETESLKNILKNFLKSFSYDKDFLVVLKNIKDNDLLFDIMIYLITEIKFLKLSTILESSEEYNKLDFENRLSDVQLLILYEKLFDTHFGPIYKNNKLDYSIKYIKDLPRTINFYIKLYDNKHLYKHVKLFKYNEQFMFDIIIDSSNIDKNKLIIYKKYIKLMDEYIKLNNISDKEVYDILNSFKKGDKKIETKSIVNKILYMQLEVNKIVNSIVKNSVDIDIKQKI